MVSEGADSVPCLVVKRLTPEAAVVAHTFNPSALEAEAKAQVSIASSNQPGLRSEALSETKKIRVGEAAHVFFNYLSCTGSLKKKKKLFSFLAC